MVKTLIFLTIVVLVKYVIGQNFFISTTQTAELVKAERRVVGMLENYVKNVETKMTVIKKYLEAFKIQTSSNTESHFEDNPLSAYLLVKRTTVDIDEIVNLLDDMEINDLHANLTAMRFENELPNEEDLHGAAIALVRLQHTYSLNASSMARGVIRSDTANYVASLSTINTKEQLSGRDCFFLGKHSLQQNLVLQSIEWFETAISKSSSDSMSNADVDEITPLLYEAIEKLEAISTNRTEGHDNVSHDFVELFNSKETFKPRLFDEFLPWQIEHDQFIRLCRGETLRPASWDLDLSCSYFKGYDPYYLLNPIKLEMASRDPYIVILHDVINDRQIELIKEIAKPNLHRSSHFSTEGGDFKTSMLRTSVNAWLTDDQHPLLETLNRKLTMITGMGTNSSSGDSEWYQVVNYGIGGHYVPHQDYLRVITVDGELLNIPDPLDEQMGDRIATFMFYLTDVEAGGATAFPTIGISIFPKKGSAAFWWNLQSNGHGDPFTRHGACPVLFGTKWVANKWFRSNSQMFKKPCHVDKNSKLKEI